MSPSQGGSNFLKEVLLAFWVNILRWMAGWFWADWEALALGQPCTPVCRVWGDKREGGEQLKSCFRLITEGWNFPAARDGPKPLASKVQPRSYASKLLWKWEFQECLIWKGMFILVEGSEVLSWKSRSFLRRPVIQTSLCPVHECPFILSALSWWSWREWERLSRSRIPPGYVLWGWSSKKWASPWRLKLPHRPLRA